MCIGPCIILIMKNTIQLDATYYFIMLMLCSTCFGHNYAHNVTAFGPDTHPSCLNLTPNQQQLQNQTTYVVTNAIVVSS